MLARLLAHLRQQWMGALALLLVLTGGTAYAANTVFSSDIVDGEVKVADIGQAAVTSEEVADRTLQGRDVVDNTLRGTQIDESTLTNVGGGGPAGGDLTGSYPNPEIAPGAVGTTEVANFSLGAFDIQANSLGGSTVNEPTLTPLDGHDSFDSECDPGSNTWLVCDELTFFLGQPMQVATTFVYGFGTDGGDPPDGSCHTTLDGADKTTGIRLAAEDDSDLALGGVPNVDVMSLDAGTHTIGLRCSEVNADSHDIVIRDISISAVELGFD